MKVYTEIVINMLTGEVLKEESFEYSGPVALCDRAAQSEAGKTQAAALGAAGDYGKGASALSGYLTPLLESWASGGAPGYGAAGVSAMKANAQTLANATANNVQQSGLLRSMRTGNSAGAQEADVAGALAAGQAQTEGVQNVLAQNAQLQASQQEGALNMLGSMYGEDVGAQMAGYGQSTNAINAQTNAGKSGWFQNMLGFMNAGANGAMTGLAVHG